MSIKEVLVIFLGVVILHGCRSDDSLKPLVFDSQAVPMGFPDIIYPEDNTYSTERWELGKRLFYDPILSVDSSISCGSCHKASLAFSDDVALSNGVKNRAGTQNSPTLANVAYHPYYTREGGVPTLEMQVLVPIQEHNEFDFNIVEAAKRIATDSIYIQMSYAAYERAPDYYVITRALANFERSLLSGNSKFDKYHYQHQETALNTEEKAGMALFFSERTQCSTCHSDFNFTNYSFENNGLDKDYSAIGRMRLTGKEEDNALFKVPTLRNIERTAPYMHDGSMATLESVIAHYNTGGETHPNKSALIQPLHLSITEQAQLLAFLKTLTDETFITEEKFKDL